jgi:hypothetical protein
MTGPTILDPSTVGFSLRDLADEVAKGGDKDAAQRLRLLREAVVQQTTFATPWSSLDVKSFIDPDLITEHYRQRRLLRSGRWLLSLIETIRNILIFFPIVITWWSISQASTTYNNYVAEAVAKHDTNALSLPFLYLWQQGFVQKGFDTQLAPFFTLSSIALWDVLILLTLIGLTLFAFFLSGASRTLEEKNTRDFYSKLVHATASATLCLQMQGRPQGGQMGGGASSSAVASLDQTAKSIRDLSIDLMNTFKTLESNLSQTFTKIGSDLNNQLSQGNQYLDTLGSTVTSLTGTANALTGLAKTMHADAKALTAANNNMTQGVTDLLAGAQVIASQQHATLQSVGSSVVQLEKAATSLDTIGKQHASLGSDLSLSLNEIKNAAAKMDATVLSMGDFAKGQADFLKQMGSEHAAQQRLTDSMSRIMLDVQDTQKELKEMAIKFRQIATDTNEVMRLYAGLPKVMGPGMVDAMQLIQKSGGELNHAADATLKVAQFFEEVVTNQKQLIDRLAASNKI